MADSIRAGVITESKGPHLDYYLRALSVCDGVTSVSVADPSGECFERAKSLLSGRGVRVFSDFREMLGSARPEFTLVTLPAHHAPERIGAALDAGSHVLAEKPSCVRAEDFARLVERARSKRLNVGLAFSNRLAPPVRKARELVQSGMLGTLYAADLYLVADQTRLTKPEFQRSWLARKETAGGGYLIWLGIHYLDLLQYVSGRRVRQVCGFARNVGGQPIEVEDAAVVALTLDRGMVATLHSGYYLDRGYHSSMTLWGSEGWVRFDLSSGKPLEWHSTHAGAPAGIQTFAYQRGDNPYLPLVQSAVDGARGVAPPVITGEESLSALELVFGIYRAAESGVAQRLS